MLTCTYSLKKAREVEFLIFLRDIVKPTIDIENLMIKKKERKKELKYIIYLDSNNLYGYAKSKFLPTGKFKRSDLKDFHLNKYNKNSVKGCVLEVDFEYLKEVRELSNDYHSTPDKIEIKKRNV